MVSRDHATERSDGFVAPAGEHGVVELDARGRIVRVSDAARRLLGVEADVRGEDHSILYDRDARAAGAPARDLQRAEALGQSEMEGWRAGKDGSPFWAEELIVPERDEAGALRGYVRIITDGTARRRAAELERAVEQCTAALVAPRGQEAPLAALAACLVPAFGDWAVIDAREDDGSTRRAAVARPGGAAPEPGLARIQPDGCDAPLPLGAVPREIGARSSLTVPIATRSVPLGTILVADSTRADRYDAAEREALEEIARRAACVLDAQRLYRRAQAAVRSRDEFLSVASHELKTPLTTLKLQLQALERAVERSSSGAPSPDRLRASLRKAHAQVDRLTHLVERLLDASRVAAGHLTLDREEVDLGLLVRELCARFTEHAEFAHSPIRCDAGARIVGSWDRLRVEQIVGHLLSNALRFGAGRPVVVEVTESCGFARLLVQDQGVGIPAEDHERIFHRFARSTATLDDGGLGLGLYIARQLAEAHGGTIRVKSSPGVGSTFTVELPLAPPGVSSAPEELGEAA